MIRHIVIWTLKEELTPDEKMEAAAKIKNGIAEIKPLLNGATKLEVITEPLAGSNGELMLDSTFADEASLHEYIVFPPHVELGKFVQSVVASRRCMNFFEV